MVRFPWGSAGVLPVFPVPGIAILVQYLRFMFFPAVPVCYFYVGLFEGRGGSGDGGGR